MNQAYLDTFSPFWMACLGGLFVWGMTSFGAAFVLLFQDPGERLMDSALGFSAGIMMAASYFSLLAPAIQGGGWLPACTGFLLGGAFLMGLDKLLPHLHLGFPIEEAEGIKASLGRSTLLVLAITLHNIPEGLAVGVAFGALAQEGAGATLVGAIAIATGIGIQDIPEGLAVAAPVRRDGLSAKKSFFLGQLSGFVEFVFAIVGALAVLVIRTLLPYALGFAAGAMLFVVIEEVIPESQRSGHHDLATTGAMLGFFLMMMLDTAL